jgi:hypothetical protein
MGQEFDQQLDPFTLAEQVAGAGELHFKIVRYGRLHHFTIVGSLRCGFSDNMAFVQARKVPFVRLSDTSRVTALLLNSELLPLATATWMMTGIASENATVKQTINDKCAARRKPYFTILCNLAEK